MNIQSLQSKLTDISTHSTVCEKARKVVEAGQSLISICSELRTCDLASVLELKCAGCDKVFKFVTSSKL